MFAAIRQRGIRLAGSVASARELLSFGTEPATRPCNFSLDLREHVTLGCLFLRHGRKFLSDLCAPVLRGFGSLLDLQKLELQFVTSSLLRGKRQAFVVVLLLACLELRFR